MPPSATAGQGFLLTINGSGFTSGSVVYWNTVVHNSASIMTNQITVQISASQFIAFYTLLVGILTSLIKIALSDRFSYRLKNCAEPILLFNNIFRQRSLSDKFV